MDDRAPRNPFPTLIAAAALALLCARAMAAPPTPFSARVGLELASAAAQSWSADAVLVYVENDEALEAGNGSADGGCERWSYLFYSASDDRARVWSVRGGRIAAAENLDMRFDAPPVAAGWLDSGTALAAAERAGGAEFRKQHHGAHLETMLLMRGAFSEGDPDATTWTLVYRASGEPSLFVVVSAADGKVQRTWRG
jgi:hypothetical protein